MAGAVGGSGGEPDSGIAAWLRQRPWFWVVLGIVFFIVLDLCLVAWALWSMQTIVK